ncbi:MAG: methionyl-tRNA formyltransferase [Acidimicrobiales bacterium]
MARLVFLGTPEVAVDPLRTLAEDGHDIALVVSRTDKRRGRGGGLVPSPLKVEARRLGLPVTDALGEAAEVGAELGVVVAYGRIIPAEVLEHLPMVNLHFSLLPRWRGAAPVERALLEGDSETGVCLMEVGSGLDTGAVYASTATAIGDDETADELRARLVAIGCSLLSEHLRRGTAGLPVPREQTGSPTYAEKMLPGELEIRWEDDPEHIDRLIRLGRAWTTFRGRRLRIVRSGRPFRPPGDRRTSLADTGSLEGTAVRTGGGAYLPLIEVQPEGGRPMRVEDWRNGIHPVDGERLGT